MTLEKAMKASVNNSAIWRFGDGREIVDGSGASRGHFWVQEKGRLTRDHYNSLEEVKSHVVEGDDWQPYNGE